MRVYQEEIISAITSKKDFVGSNVAVITIGDTTKVNYYGSVIGVIDHAKKTAKCDNCGYTNACTTARINAIKIACEKLKYTIE